MYLYLDTQAHKSDITNNLSSQEYFMRQLGSEGIEEVIYSTVSGNVLSIHALRFGGQINIAEKDNTKMDVYIHPSKKVQ